MDALDARDYGSRYGLVPVPTPPAGSGFVHVVPGAVVQRVVSVFFQLTTDANAANRIPHVEFFNGDLNTFGTVAAPFTLTANKSALYTFAIGVQQFGANNAPHIGAGLPDLPLGDGLAIGVNVADIQVGDQINGVVLFVDQWPVRD